MPRYKCVLTVKFFLTYTLFSMLKCPHINKSFSSYLSYSYHLLNSLEPDGFVWEMMYDSNGNKGITYLISDGQQQRICSKQLIQIWFLIGSVEQTIAAISSNHDQFFIDSQIFAIAASDVENNWVVWQIVKELLYFRPWFVTGVWEVWGNTIINIIDVLNLHLCWSYFFYLFFIFYHRILVLLLVMFCLVLVGLRVHVWYNKQIIIFLVY